MWLIWKKQLKRGMNSKRNGWIHRLVLGCNQKLSLQFFFFFTVVIILFDARIVCCNYSNNIEKFSSIYFIMSDGWFFPCVQCGRLTAKDICLPDRSIAPMCLQCQKQFHRPNNREMYLVSESIENNLLSSSPPFSPVPKRVKLSENSDTRAK